MITLDYETIYSIIRPCGLGPAKSKAILGLSQILVDRYDGKVPNDFAALESFPGVGHKTASVVMSQAFGVPAFAVDTHVHRLIYRWGLSSGRSVKQTERDAKRLFPKDKWSKLHLQIVFYGRDYCPAKNFNPNKCPITSVVGRRSLFR
jgi:endonuclease-3